MDLVKGRLEVDGRDNMNDGVANIRCILRGDKEVDKLFGTILIEGSFKQSGERIHHFDVRGIGKSNCPSPFAVANEYICSNLAYFVGLPVPPFCILHQGMYYFVSLQVKQEGFRPPFPYELALNNPDITTGIVLFDIFVANGDRKKESDGSIDSLLYNPGTKDVVIFDFSHALLGYQREGNADGRQESGTNLRLERLRDELGIDEPKCHSLVECLTTKQYFQKWLERIDKIPNWVIWKVVEQGCVFADRTDHRLSLQEVTTCKEFLIARKGKVGKLACFHEERFNKLKNY